MRIKQFAQLTNLPAKTIRYYEDIGLLPPAHRLDNGYRDYDETDVDKARFVAGSRTLDFSLDDIQEILALREQREAPCRVVLDLLEERADEINRRVAVFSLCLAVTGAISVFVAAVASLLEAEKSYQMCVF